MDITKVLLVDDHTLLRKGLRLLIDQEADLQVVAEADDGESAIQLAREHKPDIVVMDISLPGLNGIEATRKILAVTPQTRVLALSIHGEKDFIDDMLVAGASGYLLKESAPEELIMAIRNVMGGDIYLSTAITNVVVSEYRAVVSDMPTAAISKIEKILGHIIKTKLYPPPVTPVLELRRRLFVRLNRNIQRPLTLISAPAGYGKTVLARQWVDSSEYPSAWLSLDESDNNLGVFIGYLLTAILSAFPDLQLKTLDLLAAPHMPPVSVLARSLVNDLDQINQTFILVLDEIHLIHDSEICDMFDLLLKHPPRHLHLVLVGRHDPAFEIVSLRSRGQVTEIRIFDLRFTPEETARMMRKMLHREVNSAVAADWAHQTDGWVIALHLAVLSLRHRGQDDDLSLRIRGDSRYMREYLMAEVLSRLPTQNQNWLIKIAFLDRFCAPLSETVCQTDIDQEKASLNGETFIEWLECENLFLIPLDDQYQWFRFHHLFQEHLLDLLKAQLSAEEISALHLRASRWYAENNLIDEALQYALAVGNVESAVLLVEQNRYELMNSGQWRRLERWLGLFPASTVAQTPILLSTRAFLGIYFGLDKHILYFTNESEHLLRMLLPGTAEYQTLQAEIDAVQSLVDMVYGRTTNAIACARRSLEVLPSQALYARSIATSMTSICLQMEGKLDQGVALIRGVLEKGTWPAGFHTLLELYLSIAYYQQGDLDGVLRTASEYLQFAEEHNFSESLCYGRYFLGIAHYLRNEFVHAEPYLLALLEDRAISAPSYLATGIFALALLYHATGRESEANQVIDLLSTHLREVKDTFGWVISEAIQVELALRQDNLEQARRLSIGVNFNKRPPYWFFYIPQLTHIKLLLAEGSAEDLEEAHARLDELDEAMRVIKRNNVRIDVLVLLALVCDRQGDESGAFEYLSIALDLGSIGGNIRTFVDLGEPMANLLRRLKVQKGVENQTAYLRQLLAAFPETPISPVPVLQSQLNDPLTDRELEVLSLLSRRLSNKEIAAELVISLRTVKRHTLNIYRKLDVNSRQQAVEKAAELEILAKTR